MNRGINIFLFGVLATLLIFGFNTPLLPKFQVTYAIHSSRMDFLTAFGTLLSAIVALALGIWGSTLSQLFYKPNIEIIGKSEILQTNRQNHTESQTRLKFINNGKSIARDVIVYVESIKDNNSLRGNFIPVPLSWTHNGNYCRDFAPNETWYLDLCRINDVGGKDNPILVLAAGRGIPSYEDIQNGITTIDLKISHKTGPTRNYQLELSWEQYETYIKIDKILFVST